VRPVSVYKYRESIKLLMVGRTIRCASYIAAAAAAAAAGLFYVAI